MDWNYAINLKAILESSGFTATFQSDPQGGYIVIAHAPDGERLIIQNEGHWLLDQTMLHALGGFEPQTGMRE